MDCDLLFSDDDFVNSAPAMPKTKSVSSHNEPPAHPVDYIPDPKKEAVLRPVYQILFDMAIIPLLGYNGAIIVRYCSRFNRPGCGLHEERM